LAIGASAYVAAIFHVFTHAFFKACLFLGAGSVIHALHGEQDMRKMGGLATKMKATNLTFLFSGLALAGVAPFAGFFSKDEIIAQIYQAGGSNSIYFLFVAVALVTAFITAIYTGRQYSMVFLGERRATEPSTPAHEAPQAQPEHAAQEPSATEGVLHAPDTHDVHESPIAMTLPLWVLAAGAVLAGFLGIPHIPGVPAQLHAFADWLDPLFPHAAHVAESEVNWLLLGLGIVIGWAGWMLGRSLGINANRAMLPESANRLSLNEVYNQTVVKVGFAVAAVLRWIDEKIIDGIVNLVSGFIGQVGAALRLTQTSFISDYALAMAVGAAIVIFLLGGRFWP
ncbi:MAG TPA: proton-conducting transporter membrane subunit, partial [Abditibacteriaceae bacterium]|nr:proton-conducting transporter membrane subunit [Abditibacteriaceae bacterium]